jgi:putative DNA primase/helicase
MSNVGDDSRRAISERMMAMPLARTIQRKTEHARRKPPSQRDLFHVEAAPRIVTPQKLRAFALNVWAASGDARGKILVDQYFTSRGIVLPDDIGTDVLRYHPALRLDNERTAALVWLMRDLRSDEPTGILRVYLDEAGSVIDRRVLGQASGSAVKLTDDEHVTEGLHVASNMEDGIRALNGGLAPVWSLTSAAQLASFPVLPGIEALSIIAGPDDAQAVAEVATRWRSADREVLHVEQRERSCARRTGPT